jgi:superoxide dismutase, Fe-Mn family
MTHFLPPLRYEVSALEPHIDTRTMVLHHDMHHKAYVDALNLALARAPSLLQEKSAEWLLLNITEVPEELRSAVANNAGGHVNHSLLWEVMSPDGGGTPTGPLADAIDQSFGDFASFKALFDDTGSKLFGAGWVWLVKAPGADTLEVLTSVGHDNPLAQGYTPIIVNDVWEHAYYLKHENRRGDYLARWWQVVNWSEAALRFDLSRQAIERATEANKDLSSIS